MTGSISFPVTLQAFFSWHTVSAMQGEKDWAKYETARKLKDYAEKIRESYREDWKSKEMKTRQL